MAKLLAAFAAEPSLKNRTALQRYMDRHPMAVCMLAPAELDLLRLEGLL